MKTKIFSFVRVSETSMVASVRLARWISAQLKVPLTEGPDIADEPLDLLIIVNGAYAFSKCLPAIGAAINTAKRVVWVQQDYQIIPPKPVSEAESPFRRAFRNRRERGQPDVDFWTTCEDWTKLTKGSCYVNWNCLTFEPDAHQLVMGNRKKATDDLFYYGSWRGGGGRSSREKYFDRYFMLPQYPLTISTPAKQFNRYLEAKIAPPIREDFHEELSRHGAGLYIEDRMSHERFHSPANRFYEMLCSCLPMIFQPECGSSLRKGGYDPAPFMADKPRDVARLLRVREEIGAEQHRLWWDRAAAERAALPKKLHEAFLRVEEQL